jgi:hypothetical protein
MNMWLAGWQNLVSTMHLLTTYPYIWPWATSFCFASKQSTGWKVGMFLSYSYNITILPQITNTNYIKGQDWELFHQQTEQALDEREFYWKVDQHIRDSILKTSKFRSLKDFFEAVKYIVFCFHFCSIYLDFFSDNNLHRTIRQLNCKKRLQKIIHGLLSWSNITLRW